MVKKRYFEIINLVINSNDEITVKDISNLYNITERSIRYDIDELNVFFQEKNNKDIIEINNNRLKILYSENEIEDIVENIKEKEYFLSENERVNILSYEIFLSKNEFILQYFTEKYNLSKTTVRYSLKELNKIISEYGLVIDMNNNRGYKIIGSEINIRKYIINILREYIKNTKEKKIEYDPLKKIIQKFYKKSRIEESKNTINKILDYTGKTISDEAFETLQLFLFISVIRNKNGHEIEEDVENEIFLSKTKEFSKIREILEKVENIKEKDIHYFVDFFLGSYSYNLEYSYFLNWILIESLIDQFIKLLSDKLKVNLTEDKILRKELLNHIKPAIYRMKNKFKLTESILSEVKKQYMELFIKTKSSLKIISDFIDLSFDEDEAAFITVMIQRAIMRNNPSTLLKKDPNILIVCGLGYSSSRFLYENINNRFQVNIIDIIPFNQLENYNYLKKADIIISTLDFKLDGIDVITVNAVMNEKDILKLKNYGLPEKKSKIKLSELLSIIKKVSDETELKKQLMRNFGENIYDDMGEKSETGKSFVELLSEKSIKLNVAANNLDEVIEITGQTMIDSGLVKEEYTDELKNQIIQYGKYILVGDKTILPHGQLLKNVRETGFSLITLKKGIDFFGSEIKIVICLASRNKDEHLRAILELNRYLKNPDFENELLNKENSEELTDYLKFLEMADI
ncbi:PRD domain protein [Leptotrichia sp. oral taxon 215 str. W9775]|uniref:BglG family transcription antiterminator n=1 Tax=Leptotrichia sp. oral taxon 215 TaxID=712359 RepID=UPI0003AE04C1|nr:PTS sugar transporter subunit IIA [Leptotrichia sp. oral taxon 215]ERK67549.1 PRD domain protein [Leptotrichia sp. oral taxon 215 str. W9775]